MTKAWGATAPQELVKIFKFLCEEVGFNLPENWKDPYTLMLQKRMADDLIIKALFCTAGQYPQYVFNFDVGIALCSEFCRKIEDQTDIWPNRKSSAHETETSSGIFCIDLSHLKWNETSVEKNPIFQISELPGYQDTAKQWILDWENFATPLLASVSNLDDAIQYCEFIKTYKKQVWVKSDGYLSSALDIHWALLCAQDGQYEKAKNILQNSLELQTHPPSVERHKKALSWVEAQIANSR